MQRPSADFAPRIFGATYIGGTLTLLAFQERARQEHSNLYGPGLTAAEHALVTANKREGARLTAT